MVYEFKKSIGNLVFNIKVEDIADQANGAVLIKCGETIVLATVVMSDEINEDLSFFPLQVNYSEKFYAAGRIPGGYLKREGKPRDKEVLISRMIDRPIRPLFPEGLRNEVQVLANTISFDQEIHPDILSIIGVSSALSISDIPFNGPIGAVRVGLDDTGNFLLNPNFVDIQKNKMDLVVVGKDHKVLMLEGRLSEISEEVVQDALNWSMSYIQDIIDFQKEFCEKIGKEKVKLKIVEICENLKNSIYKNYKDPMRDVLLKGKSYKAKAKMELKNLKNEAMEKYTKDETVKKSDILSIFDDLEYDIARDFLFDKNIRVDGRNPDQVREIKIEQSVLPRAHGSAIFKRGETKSLGVVTLGTTIDAQRLDDFDGDPSKRFMLHYNFHPFSVGEVFRLSGVSRREIGHGSIAEKAILPILPEWKNFPYTIRVVSEILESNGSSSMASVSSASLALFNAGVPVSRHISGIAMGLMMKNNDEYVILTDIQGIEDKLGDMDFKIAGSKEGITVIQLDVKLDGIKIPILYEALKKAKNVRTQILDKMIDFIPTPASLSNYAPKIITMNIKVEKIKDIIGPSGRVIRRIIDQTGVDINIDDNNGFLIIQGKDSNSVKEAKKEILSICEEVEIGKIYKGIIKKVSQFGIFVEILPGKEGLCPISRISKTKKITKFNINDMFKVKDFIKVKCSFIDKKGRIFLSIV